jgi:hypothetical protein
MRSKQTNICLALAVASSLAISTCSAQASTTNAAAASKAPVRVEAIPETTFSDPTSITKFGILVTGGYPPKQLTLKNGNGVADFVQSPSFYFDAQSQPIASSQILADGSTPYTKVIPFEKSFHLHFEVTMINPVPPAFGPFGGDVFELHDTDPVFAQYGDPGPCGIRLVNQNGTYAFFANNVSIWTGPVTLKTKDRFELNGVLQENNSTVNDGKLELRRNGVVVATSTGPNCNSMTPYYPYQPGTPPTPTGPPPHPLTSGPHVRLGLGKVPTPYQPGPVVTTEDYIDNVEAHYWQ